MLGIILSILTAATVFASPLKTVDDYYKESEAQFKKAEKEKDFSHKSKHLKALHKSLEAGLEAYRKQNATEGSDAEQDVSRLFHTLEPAFEISSLKKVTAQDCAQKKQWAKTDDRMGRDEQAPLTKSTEEVLRWIEILCK